MDGSNSNDDPINNSNENVQTTTPSSQEENDTNTDCDRSNAMADTSLSDEIHLLLQESELSETDKKLINGARFYITHEYLAAVTENCTVKIYYPDGRCRKVKKGNGDNVLSVQMEHDKNCVNCHWSERANTCLYVREGLKDIYDSKIFKIISPIANVLNAIENLHKVKNISQGVIWLFQKLRVKQKLKPAT